MRLKLFICAVLFNVTLAIYWPARHFDIIYYDDPVYLQTPEEAKGFIYGIKWAMTAVVVGNWHPVTSFSFLLGHQWWGLNPGAEHMVNVVFHAANAALLFLVLVKMANNPIANSLTSPLPSPLPSDGRGEGTATERRARFHRRNIWLCAFVAGIFAWHPLRVESVAWITERKDVLFLFFMLLALICYTTYAQAGKRSPKQHTISPAGNFPVARTGWYVLSLVFFGLSFMSKAMVVTLPFLLLLLDFWPLKRLSVNAKCGARSGPSPHPNPLPSHQMGAERGQPSNKNRVGPKAGRMTGVWLVAEKIPFFALAIYFSAMTFKIQRESTAVAALNEFGMTERLENATLNYANYLGHFFWPTKLALLYPYPKRFDGLEVLFTALLLAAITAWCLLQLSRRPYLAVGWLWYLGTMVPVIGLVQIGEAGMADRYTYLPMIGPVISLVWLMAEWAGRNSPRKYLAVSAGAAVLCACIVLTRAQVMLWRNSAALFERTVAVTQENGMAEFLLAQGLQEEGRLCQAAVHYRMAIAMPNAYHYFANLNFAMLLQQRGYYQEADTHYEKALQFNPYSLIAMNNLAWMLATCPDAKVRNGARAVQLGEQACQLINYRVTLNVGTLAAAYAEAGRFDDAIATAQQAIALAQEHGNGALLKKNEELLRLYQAHEAYHEPKLVPDSN